MIFSTHVNAAIICIGLIIGGLAQGQIAKTITYQGILKDASGTRVTGTVALDLNIYKASGGGTIYTDSHASVDVANGLFTVVIGTGDGGPIGLPFNEPYELGVTVNAGTELSPRTLLTAEPYALNAYSVNIPGGSNGDVLTNDGTGNGVWVDADLEGSAGIAANATDIATNTAGIANNATAIATETTRAMGAELANADAITAEATTARAAETANANAIAAEATTARTAETANATAIANNATGIANNAADIAAHAGDTDTHHGHSHGTNTFLGENAGNPTMTGGYNTASGIYALYDNTEGNYNTASGYYALRSNTEGNDNTASGHTALYRNTTGNYNTASGANTLFDNTEGGYNTASGYDALFSNTTGNYNTASGVYALRFNTEGNVNTASGYRALFSNTTGNYNTASGVYALFSNTTGENNTASGVYALYSNTEGNRNTASGANTLVSNTTGGYNTASGAIALNSNTKGNKNTASGDQALRYNTEGNDNTASGALAGDKITTGSQNTIIGSYADPSSTSAENQIAIGYNVQGVADNTAVIGNSSLTDLYVGQNGQGMLHGDVTGNLFGNVVGDVTGNADTVDGLEGADLEESAEIAANAAAITAEAATARAAELANANAITAEATTARAAEAANAAAISNNATGIANNAADIAAHAGDTDTHQLTEAQVDSYVSNNGYLTAATASATIQAKSFANRSVNGGTSSSSMTEVASFTPLQGGNHLTPITIDFFIKTNWYTYTSQGEYTIHYADGTSVTSETFSTNSHGSWDRVDTLSLPIHSSMRATITRISLKAKRGSSGSGYAKIEVTGFETAPTGLTASKPFAGRSVNGGTSNSSMTEVASFTPLQGGNHLTPTTIDFYIKTNWHTYTSQGEYTIHYADGTSVTSELFSTTSHGSWDRVDTLQLPIHSGMRGNITRIALKAKRGSAGSGYAKIEVTGFETAP